MCVVNEALGDTSQNLENDSPEYQSLKIDIPSSGESSNKHTPTLDTPLHILSNKHAKKSFSSRITTPTCGYSSSIDGYSSNQDRNYERMMKMMEMKLMQTMSMDEDSNKME